MKALGRRIKARRVKMGLSQTALGAAVGRSHSQIHNLEYGRTSNPPAELLTALALALGEDPEEYLKLAGRVSLTASQVIPAEPVGVDLLMTIQTTIRDVMAEDREAWAQAVARAVVVALRETEEGGVSGEPRGSDVLQQDPA